MLKIIRAQSASALVLLLTVLATAARADEIPPSLDTSTPCAKPAYPRASLVNEEKGTVTLAFLIGSTGNIVESKVDKSSGFKNLDKAALNGFSQCKFKPGVKNGKPEELWVKINYVWVLE